ncbi:MAG: Cna B-type, partial [Rivularia sp. (in: cyanobacteria)]
MLYLALPPTQPPIVSTLTGERRSAQAPSLHGGVPLTPQSATQNNGCESLPNKSQKSDLVNNLLGKILANSVSTKPCTVENKKSEISQNNTQKSQKDNTFTAIPLVSTSVKQVEQKSIKQAAVESNISPNSLEKSSIDEQSESKNHSVEKNTIEKILATVQQLINVSLYASINNSIDNTVEPQTENSSELESSTKSAETSNNQNLEANSSNNNNNNNNNKKIAGNTNINTAKIIAVVQELITASISASLNNTISNSLNIDTKKSGEIALSNPDKENQENNNIQTINPKQNIAATNNNTNNSNSLRDSLIDKLRDNNLIKLAQIPGEPFLVGVVINGREVGVIDIIEENNTLLIPLETFSEISGFSVKKSSAGIETQTPLGTINFPPNVLKTINDLNYISKEILQEKLGITLELNTADLTLLADLPWRGGSRQNLTNAQLKPEFFAPSTGISRLRQELNIVGTPRNTNLQSYTLLDGRLAGGTWRVQMNNNF